jgi:hypothetical protein
MSQARKSAAKRGLPDVGELLQHFEEFSIQDIEELGDEELKQQQQRQQQPGPAAVKELTLHSEVVFGAGGLRGSLRPMKVRYSRGQSLFPDRADLQAVPGKLKRAMVIRMPLENVQEYIDHHIRGWLPLQDDDWLVEQLHDYLADQPKARAKGKGVRFPDILGTRLFSSLDKETQLRVEAKVKQVTKQKARFQRESTGEDLTTLPLLDLFFRKRRRESKRQEKARNRLKRIAELQFFEGMKPRDIARKQQVHVRQVYNTTQTVKLKLRAMVQKLEGGGVKPEDLVPTKRTRLRDDPGVQQAVRDYLQEHGIH